jgi:hypothetical protein
LAAYLIGTGHFFAGPATVIPAFGSGYRYWRQVVDVVESLEGFATTGSHDRTIFAVSLASH